MALECLKSHCCFSGLTAFYQHDSTSTKTPMKFSVHRPEEKSEIKNAIIWLSGLTCNEENFITKAGVQRYLDGTQTMIVCPDTSPRGLDLPNEHENYDFGSGASFFLNAKTQGYKDHYQMEDYIACELVALLQKEFGVEKVSIMGHSMGGHGALVLGLRYPKLFKAISAFSPVSHPTQCPWGKKAFKGYLGEDESLWKTYDATEMILAGSTHPQRILLDQGLADNFLEEQLLVQDLKEACREKGQELELNLRDGFDHSYYFIASFVESHIKHHLSAFES
jgi:S-formylglutathione hydrolase